MCVNALGNKINTTPVYSAKIGKFQDTITSSKIVVLRCLKKHFTGKNLYSSDRYLKKRSHGDFMKLHKHVKIYQTSKFFMKFAKYHGVE